MELESKLVVLKVTNKQAYFDWVHNTQRENLTTEDAWMAACKYCEDSLDDAIIQLNTYMVMVEKLNSLVIEQEKQIKELRSKLND